MQKNAAYLSSKKLKQPEPELLFVSNEFFILYNPTNPTQNDTPNTHYCWRTLEVS